MANEGIILSGFGLPLLKTQFYGFGEDAPDEGPELPASYLGTPVFTNVHLLGGGYKDLDGKQTDYGGGAKGEGVVLNTVLVSVGQTKIIKKTQIQGRNGSVKEYISDGDYAIQIRGVIVDPSGSAVKYPEKEVRALVEMLQAQTSIGITSRFLNIFDVTNITIESYELPQSEGVQNAQLFEIRAVSDDPIELTIRQ